jgi:hypothetical protein
MNFHTQTRLIALAICCGTVVSSCNYSEIVTAQRVYQIADAAYTVANINWGTDTGNEAQFPDARYESQVRTKQYLPSNSSTDYVVCIKATTRSSGAFSWDEAVKFAAWVKEAKKRELGLKKCKAIIEA